VIGALVDLLAYELRALRCLLRGRHEPTYRTDPTCCKRCGRITYGVARY
jgi:hypothetical protein